MQRLAITALAVLALPCAGCRVLRPFWPTPPGPAAPQVLPENATLSQVIDAVNHNTARVQTYEVSGSRISTPGMPTLRADIAIQRPRRFRLRGGLTSLTGTELDLGSNDEQFWFWMRRSQPPALYYAGHREFAASPIRDLVPVDPEWLIEAVGLAAFDSAGEHSGPQLVRGERLEVRSVLHQPSGDAVKVTVVDGRRAWVLEQHVYTSSGERVASAVASRHRYDPATGVSLPEHVEVHLPQAQLLLQIDLDGFRVNQLVGNPAELFTRPAYPGVPEVDLGRVAMQRQRDNAQIARRPLRLPLHRLPHVETQRTSRKPRQALHFDHPARRW